MEENVVTHVGEEKTCANIKSLRTPKIKCKNPATHGEYCGHHYKTPRPWVPGTPKEKKRKISKLLLKKDADAELVATEKIQNWWRVYAPFFLFRTRGPAYYLRTCPVNDTDFFSCDKIADVSGAMFYSYSDADKHVYGFDIRSIHSLCLNARNAGASPENPYTRTVIPTKVIEQVAKIVRLLTAHNVCVTWAPLAPPTPEQQFRMKVVDVFHIIDELNYYSSPDWFLQLDARGHRRFYTELHDIWGHRAGMTLQQKSSIVPGFQGKLFRSAPWVLRDLPLEVVAKLNLNTIRLFVGSAEDRNDKILGAMYVVTALTLVSPAARDAYPWLYETVEPAAAMPFPGPPPIIGGGLIGLGWLNEFIQAHAPLPPPLQLPPPNNG